MARIIVADLHPLDSEKSIVELTHLEDKYVFGGGDEYSDQFFNVALKLIQAFVVTTAINTISSLTISYLNND